MDVHSGPSASGQFYGIVRGSMVRIERIVDAGTIPCR